MWLPRYRYRVTDTASMLNNVIPSAERGIHRPLGPVNTRRNSFHFQRCNAFSQRATRYQVNCASLLKVCLQTACRK